MNLWHFSRKFYILRQPINRKSTMIPDEIDKAVIQ